MALQNTEKPLAEIVKVFLKLGCIGFGGPAVHIAMMEDEVVSKRQWMSKEHFLDLVGATNLIPGPNSTEMAMHCGHEKAGWKGLILAGICFILPAVVITGILAYAYQQYGKLPHVQPFIYGIKPAIIAVVASMVLSLGKKAVKSIKLGAAGIVAALLALFNFNEIYILFGAGFSGILFQLIKSRTKIVSGIYPFILLHGNSIYQQIFDWKIFWIFLKIGAILYGSGYVLFAFLDAELVNTGLLSKQGLADAIAVGQITPGPVFSSATFIGWQIGDFPGSLAATIGIFLPSFVFVILLNPFIQGLRKSKIMASFLDMVNVASVAIILAICLEMGKASIMDWRTALIAILSFVIAIKFKRLNSAFIVVSGAFCGYLLSLVK